MSSLLPKVIDLFSGVGGLSLGFRRAGFDIVIANEYDSSIANAYVKNNPDTKMVVGDITKLDLGSIFNRELGADVVIGGPPCQGFSQKGKRMSIDDPRNFLFKYFVKVVELVRPRYFVMENVPNLLTSENGFFKDEIIKRFERIGYKLSAKILDASDFGVPQSRKRSVIIGKKGQKKIDIVVVKRNRNTIWDAISDLNFLNSGEGEYVQQYRCPPCSNYQEEMRKNSYLLYNHVATQHSMATIRRLNMIPPNAGRESLPEEELTKSIYSGTWSRMRCEEVSVTITTRFDTPSSGRFVHPFLNRAITVREAARIQSFPDDYIFTGTKSSQMKQVGNAVPPILAQEIASIIMRDIIGE